MTINEATTLISGAFGESSAPETWVDLGCGDGLFTRALSSLLPANSKVYAVDQRHQNIASLPTVSIQFIQANFETDDLPLPELDGLLMANALHFVKDKSAFLKPLLPKLSSGKFVIVEYEMTQPNRWVPYPIPFASTENLFKSLGFSEVRKLTELPSRYGPQHMYACVAEF